MTATEQDSWPPRVLVSVTGLVVGSSVTLYRVALGERQLVRAGHVDAIADSAFLRTDAELPFGVPVSYLLLVDEFEEFTTPPVVHALPGGRVAVTDAISGRAADTVIMAWPERTRGRRASTFDVGGRTVAVLGPVAGASSTIEFYAETTAALDALVAVIDAATEGVVQLRQPGGYDGVDGYVAVLSTVERRWSQDGTDPRRVLAVDVVEVEAWVPELEARGTTLQDIADAYLGLSLLDISNGYPTLLDLARADL